MSLFNQSLSSNINRNQNDTEKLEENNNQTRIKSRNGPVSRVRCLKYFSMTRN